MQGYGDHFHLHSDFSAGSSADKGQGSAGTV